jgi:hypothetical protein
MKFTDAADLATEHADRIAPMGKHDPAHVAIASAAICGVVVFVFTGLAGLDRDSLIWPIGITVAVSFIVPFVVLRLAHKNHSKACVAMINSLRDEHGFEN